MGPLTAVAYDWKVFDRKPRHSPSSTHLEPEPFRLSIVMPAYNESATIEEVAEQMLAVSIPGDIELIFVDDGSSDATGEILERFSADQVMVLHHESNRGKGAAVRTGIAHATGTHLLIFDADSEYDPEDIPRLVAPLLTGRAEVVFGSRMSGFGTVHPSFIHALGNRLMTLSANILFGCAISDLHTCLKLLPLPLVRSFELKENGFGLDTEISAEMLRSGFRPFEVPASYVGRSKQDGKKVRLIDALRCVYVLLEVRLRGSTRYGDRDRSLAPRVFDPKAA